VTQDPESDLPDDQDVIIWHLPDRDDLDLYRVTKGATVLGEFTGRSIGSTVFQAAVEHAEPGRSVWLKDEREFRRLNPKNSVPGGRQDRVDPPELDLDARDPPA
jgi:hypothetical protein